mgnify:CR=1 FL=1
MEINKPLYVILVLIVAGFLFSFFVLPKYQESKNMELTLYQKQVQYESRFNFYSKLEDILASIEQNKDALDKINSALPKEFSLANVVYFFNQKADESGLSLKSIGFSEQNLTSSQKNTQNINDVLFAVNLSGSYDGLKEFLYSVESSSRIFEVNSIAFSSGQGTEAISSKGYDFSLIIKTHTY